MERAENDSAVFRPFHKPWKSIKPIPTFQPPRRRRSIYERIPKRSRPCCPPQTDPSGSSLDWKRLPTLRTLSCLPPTLSRQRPSFLEAQLARIVGTAAPAFSVIRLCMGWRSVSVLISPLGLGKEWSLKCPLPFWWAPDECV